MSLYCVVSPDCPVKSLWLPKNHQLRTILRIRHHFLGKPLGILYALDDGLPKPHKVFWSQFTVEKLFSLYKAMNATPSSVLGLLEEPEFENQAEARVYDYFKTYIGNCKERSSAVVVKSIVVSFNNLSGLARRPINHTCSLIFPLPIKRI